jgi:hypothetical protein
METKSPTGASFTEATGFLGAGGSGSEAEFERRNGLELIRTTQEQRKLNYQEANPCVGTQEEHEGTTEKPS